MWVWKHTFTSHHEVKSSDNLPVKCFRGLRDARNNREVAVIIVCCVDYRVANDVTAGVEAPQLVVCRGWMQGQYYIKVLLHYMLIIIILFLDICLYHNDAQNSTLSSLIFCLTGYLLSYKYINTTSLPQKVNKTTVQYWPEILARLPGTRSHASPM